MPADGDDEQFQYDGHLLFNEFGYTVDVERGSLTGVPREIENSLLGDMLDTFDIGTSREPGEGFERSLIRDYANDLPPETQEFIESLVALNYKIESFDTEEAEVDGERRNVKLPDVNSANLFWQSPDNILVRGAEGSAEEARSQTQNWLSGNASVQTVRFKHDFLFWLFYKHFENKELTESLEIDRLADAQAEGQEDILGKSNIVEEAPDVKYAPNFLLCLIHGKSISMLQGDFVLRTGPSDNQEETIRVEIRPEKIYPKASKAGLRNSQPAEKMAFATHTANELINVFKRWDELPPENSDKYPPPDFIAEMVRRCHEQGVDIHNQSTVLQVLEQQANRRGEELEQYSDELSDVYELLAEPDET
jgi:hypothetical protein